MARVAWKKDAREAGLSRVSQGERGHELRVDGEPRGWLRFDETEEMWHAWKKVGGEAPNARLKGRWELDQVSAAKSALERAVLGDAAPVRKR